MAQFLSVMIRLFLFAQVGALAWFCWRLRGPKKATCLLPASLAGMLVLSLSFSLAEVLGMSENLSLLADLGFYFGSEIPFHRLGEALGKILHLI